MTFRKIVNKFRDFGGISTVEVVLILAIVIALVIIGASIWFKS